MTNRPLLTGGRRRTVERAPTEAALFSKWEETSAAMPNARAPRDHRAIAVCFDLENER